MMPGFDLESGTFRAALELFKRMEIAEVVYESVGAPSQTKDTRSDSNQASRRKKREENPPHLQFMRRKLSQAQEQIYTLR